jgi:hypothetical protein
MNQSDATYELVKSLTQNEKRYFRVFSASTGNDKNYLRVFDVLDKMKVYDSKALNKKLAGKKINISYEKNYLYKQLLKTLRTFYTESNSSIELQDTLKSIEVLYRKRLTAHCQKLVDKGLTIAKKFELWNYHLELLEWQYRIYARNGNYKKLMAFETEGLVEKEALLDQMQAYAQVQRLIFSAMSIVQNQGGYINKQVGAELKNAISEAQLLVKNYKSCFRILELAYSVIYISLHYLGNFKEGYVYALKNYELYQQHEHFKIDSAFKFFACIGNLINRCINTKRYEDGLKYIQELKSFVKRLSPFALQDIQQEQMSAVFGYESRILLGTKRFADALKAAKEFERVYINKNLRKNILLTDTTNLARVYFANDLLRESLKRLNTILNESPEGVKLEFFVYAHLLRLCIHVDLENYDVLNHLVQTAQRFFQKNEIKDDYASAFLVIIKLVSKADDQKMRKQLFAAHCAGLRKLAAEPFEQYFELSDWMEGKITSL